MAEPVRKTDIRTKKLIEFPSSHNNDSVETEQQVSSNDEVVRETDTNNNIVVVSLEELEEQQQLEVSVHVQDTPKSSQWRYVGQGLPRVYLPPELDQETGSKIESIHDATKRPRQGIIKEAVDLLYNRLNHIPSVLEERKQPKLISVGAVAPSGVGIPDEVLVALASAGIDLGMNATERLWSRYSDKFEDALAYTIAQDAAGKIRESKSGYFRRSLEEGWNFASKTNLQKDKSTLEIGSNCTQVGIDEPTAEEMALIDNAIANGRARAKYCGSLGWLVIRPSGHSEPWRDFLEKG